MAPLFEIDRRFAAPPEKVFKAWTDPEDLKQWFSPAGMSMSQAKMDLRPGGGFHYALRAPTGFEMWGMWEFEEIKAPEKLVLLQYFSDAKGGVTRHPLSATWPLRTRSTTRFLADGAETVLSIAWSAHEAEPAEVATFEAAAPMVRQAWGGTFDQLARFLSL